MFKQLILLLFVLLVSVSCSTLFGSNLDYDNSSNAIVIYADIQAYPGAPPPGKECLRRFVPRLRIWGDGLIFLDIGMFGRTPPFQWNGQLDQEQLRSILKFLNDQGFFGKWNPGIPNPAGTWFKMGANLKSKNVEYLGGDLEPQLYADLVRQIMPHLTPLEEQPSDMRVRTLLSENKGCGNSN